MLMLVFRKGWKISLNSKCCEQSSNWSLFTLFTGPQVTENPKKCLQWPKAQSLVQNGEEKIQPTQNFTPKPQEKIQPTQTFTSKPQATNR